MPPTQNSIYRAKKAQKRNFFTTGLSKIIGPKNKKPQNDVRFLFYIYVIAQKSTAYAKFRKKTRKSPKIFFEAPQG